MAINVFDNFRNGSMTLKQAVELYRAQHPTATVAEVSEALNANPKTVYVYVKGYAENRGKGGGPAEPGTGPEGSQPPRNVRVARQIVPPKTILDQLRDEENRLNAQLESVKLIKDQLLKVRAAIAAFETPVTSKK